MTVVMVILVIAMIMITMIITILICGDCGYYCSRGNPDYYQSRDNEY